MIECRQLMTGRSSAALPEPAQADIDRLSSSSFNEGEGSVELSNQSQAASVDQGAPSEKAVEELLEVADERVSQAEQRAIKAEEASQAQEGLISQLCDENLKLGEEVQRLNSGYVSFVLTLVCKHNKHDAHMHFTRSSIVVITSMLVLCIVGAVCCITSTHCI